MYKSRLLLLYAAVLASIAILTTASQAQQKTAKACESEWTANKAAIQGSGKTKKAFMIECRSGSGAAATAPSAAPPAGQGAASTEIAPAPAAPRTAKRNRTGTTVSTGAAEYASELEAKAHCPGEPVVWANTHSKVYHFAGSRSYGNTKRGAYMCEKDTASAGLRSAKNEKRPQ
jgi:hypothetical protein